MEPVTDAVLLPGAEAAAPYGRTKAGKARQNPTRDQVKFLEKAGLSAQSYGWKREPRPVPEALLEKLRASVPKMQLGRTNFYEKQKARMAELFGADWKEKGHSIRELRVVRVEVPDPAAEPLPAAELEKPYQKRKRTSVAKKVAASMDQQKTELAAVLGELKKEISSARDAAVQASLLAQAAHGESRRLGELARQNSLERKTKVAEPAPISSAPQRSEPPSPADKVRSEGSQRASSLGLGRSGSLW
jgi:hypothetical protein